MTSKAIFKFPQKIKFNAMWGQISGMADCCGAGVIGRLSGTLETRDVLYMDDASILKEKYKKFTSMRNYIMCELPRNILFSGPPEWLHWAIVEDLLTKKTIGLHTPQIKAPSINTQDFDFENNTYHKFWAASTYKVQMWFITDRIGAYMNHHEEICCNRFLEFISKYNLGDVWKSTKIPGSYGRQKIWGAIYHPNFIKIAEQLPKVISDANKELEHRWETILPHLKDVPTITDKIAKKW